MTSALLRPLRRARLVVALALAATAGCGDDASGAGPRGSGDAGADHDSGATPGSDAGSPTTTPDAGGGSGAPDAGGGTGAADAGGSTTLDAGGDAGTANGGACDVDQSCDFACGAACKVECLGGICTARCDDGSCELDSDFEGRSTYSCTGGRCLSDCDAQSSCALDCAGGGCEVACDNGSVCSLACSETGDPCVITCSNGGRGWCDGENCMAIGCEAACEADETYQPTIDPSDFSTTIDNPFLPLPIGAQWIYESSEEVVTVTVTDEARTVMGVEVVVVHDQVRTPDGELIEDTFDWYAQDADGNVWYFGEDTTEYENGAPASSEGSWEAGVDGALPGIVMEAQPAVGDRYRQEYAVCEAEDLGEVVALDESVHVPAGSYTGCIRTRDYTPLEPASNEFKIYCPGVGNVQVIQMASGEVAEELTSVTLP